jgi:hypothetical protein
MENMGTSWGRGHEQHDLVEVVPPLVSEGLGFGVLLNCYESTTRLARLERLRISGVRVFAS